MLRTNVVMFDTKWMDQRGRCAHDLLAGWMITMKRQQLIIFWCSYE